MSDRMTVRDGKVYVSEGMVQGIDFEACVITLGRRASIIDCTLDALSEVRQEPADPTPVRCDYCGDQLPNVESRAHTPTTPNLQRRGFAADKVVCPECVAKQEPGDPS